ncbi:MAG: hypothetical protein Q9O62_11830, partial [Ardenticatenia bacterium]|nr:hypothetical protein [Ardenticatenia bacterium]
MVGAQAGHSAADGLEGGDLDGFSGGHFNTTNGIVTLERLPAARTALTGIDHDLRQNGAVRLIGATFYKLYHSSRVSIQL